MPYVALHVFLNTVPYLALAAWGIVLFNRNRTVPTGLVALGFTAVAVTHMTGWLVSYKFSYIYSSGGDVVAAMGRFHGWVWMATYWGDIIGIWVATAGLLWHTVRSANASPNNRWRGP